MFFFLFSTNLEWSGDVSKVVDDSVSEDLLHEVSQLSESILQLSTQSLRFGCVAEAASLEIVELTNHSVDIVAKSEQAISRIKSSITPFSSIRHSQPVLWIESVRQFACVFREHADGLHSDTSIVDAWVVEPSERLLQSSRGGMRWVSCAVPLCVAESVAQLTRAVLRADKLLELLSASSSQALVVSARIAKVANLVGIVTDFVDGTLKNTTIINFNTLQIMP